MLTQFWWLQTSGGSSRLAGVFNGAFNTLQIISFDILAGNTSALSSNTAKLTIFWQSWINSNDNTDLNLYQHHTRNNIVAPIRIVAVCYKLPTVSVDKQSLRAKSFAISSQMQTLFHNIQMIQLPQYGTWLIVNTATITWMWSRSRCLGLETH